MKGEVREELGRPVDALRQRRRRPYGHREQVQPPLAHPVGAVEVLRLVRGLERRGDDRESRAEEQHPHQDEAAGIVHFGGLVIRLYSVWISAGGSGSRFQSIRTPPLTGPPESPADHAPPP